MSAGALPRSSSSGGSVGKTPVAAAQFRQVLSRNLALPLAVGGVSVAAFIGLMLYVVSLLTWVDHTQRVIASADEVSTATVDLETGVRGFQLTGDDRFLEPYRLGKPRQATEMAALTEMVRDNPPQVQRLQQLAALQRQWDAIAQRAVAQRRQQGAAQPADAEGGKQLADAMRRELAAFTDIEKALLKQRTDEARNSTLTVVVLYALFILGLGALIALYNRRQLLGLSGSYSAALQEQADDAGALAEQAWARDGQAQLAQRLVGQPSLTALGQGALQVIADYLGAVVGAVYSRDAVGMLHRVATHAFGAEQAAQRQSFLVGDGVVGQTVLGGRVQRLTNLQSSYFDVTSALGRAAPAEVVLVPTSNDGSVNGVVELGFLRPVSERDVHLLELIAPTLGAAFEAARYRQRLQDMLEETHGLNEELQAQQEELRTANEELSEQARVLLESQASLEQQQAELEQTNSQLAEQAQMLDKRNNALTAAQAELQQGADELRRASRYKSEFLANMSHELRTPLNSALILAKLLADNKPGNLNGEQVRFANTIYSAGNDLLGLVNDILDLSKVEAGKLDLSLHSVSMVDLLQSLRSTFEPIALDKHLAFSVRALPRAPATIVTDRQRLEQVLKNLLSNALKFTERGSVSLTVDGVDGSEVAFAVQDTGIGIAADQQANIFEAFQQADGAINRRYGGTGLGLSISRALAGLLGGHMRLQSSVGSGSTFTLQLPLRMSEEGARAAEAAVTLPGLRHEGGAQPSLARPDTSPPAPATPERESTGSTAPFADDRAAVLPGDRPVLVIEDDLRFAEILFDLAHEMNHRCLVATTAADGYTLATQHKPRAILLDVRLPDGSGLGLLQQLKDHPQTRHIPVHVLSSDDSGEVALHLGAAGFAVKPKSREQLRDIFARLEALSARKVKRVLVVEDDARQRDSVVQLISDDDIEIAAVALGAEALAQLRTTVFDCMIIDLKLPDMDGSELLERMMADDIASFPPVIVYTGRNLTHAEEAALNRYSRSIIIKGARSPERLLDEVTLFLHSVESRLSAEHQRMLQSSRSRDKVFDGRKVLLVDDDVRNIFALTAALEQKGLAVEVARDGFEALQQLQAVPDIDLVLMDVMMPGMDGLEATRRIRADQRWHKLPVIAVTAKAMKDDQEQCRKAGANDYLAKPIELDRLFSLLRVWMPSIERL